jgi:outer membrane lipoprotein-sorting protein
MKKLALLALLLCAFVSPAFAALSDQDKADLARVSDYLNTLQRIEAAIMQVNPDGSVIGGKLKIQRPGKLRLDYDPPNNSLLIADGSFVHFWDAPMKETSSVPQGGSPAALILDAQINFDKGMTVTKVERIKNTIEVTMYKTDDRGNGEITLVLEDKPLQLRQWRVRDAQNSITTVTLQNMDTNPQFAGGTFVYTKPRNDKNR